jgi:hypothetical protein
VSDDEKNLLITHARSLGYIQASDESDADFISRVNASMNERKPPEEAPSGELRQYPISYAIEHHNPPLTRSEVLALGRGGCHSIMAMTVMRSTTGERGQNLQAMEGSTGLRPPPKEIFLAWLTLAHSMANDERLSGRERVFAGEVFRAYHDLLSSEEIAKPRLTLVRE